MTVDYSASRDISDQWSVYELRVLLLRCPRMTARLEVSIMQLINLIKLFTSVLIYNNLHYRDLIKNDELNMFPGAPTLQNL